MFSAEGVLGALRRHGNNGSQQTSMSLSLDSEEEEGEYFCLVILQNVPCLCLVRVTLLYFLQNRYDVKKDHIFKTLFCLVTSNRNL